MEYGHDTGYDEISRVWYRKELEFACYLLYNSS